jgi:hypothetical protein
MCDVGLVPQSKKITVELSVDEARELRELMRHARAFAWKLRDAMDGPWGSSTEGLDPFTYAVKVNANGEYWPSLDCG